jgi:hypothetical protein
MPKSNLETSISQAAASFALHIVNAVKGATLQELIAMHSEGSPKKMGRKPGRKTGSKLRKKPGPKPGQKRAKPGPKPKAKTAATKVVKKRIVKNYPKCAYPRCDKNRFVRGKGFCGDHWNAWLAGKIKSAAEYKKK